MAHATQAMGVWGFERSGHSYLIRQLTEVTLLAGLTGHPRLPGASLVSFDGREMVIEVGYE